MVSSICFVWLPFMEGCFGGGRCLPCAVLQAQSLRECATIFHCSFGRLVKSSHSTRTSTLPRSPAPTYPQLPTHPPTHPPLHNRAHAPTPTPNAPSVQVQLPPPLRAICRRYVPRGGYLEGALIWGGMVTYACGSRQAHACLQKTSLAAVRGVLDLVRRALGACIAYAYTEC